MRTEELENEAKLYSGEGKCYVHIEQANVGELKMISEGDPTALLSALYCLTIEVANRTERKPLEIWKMFIKTFRKHGVPEHHEF